MTKDNPYSASHLPVSEANTSSTDRLFYAMLGTRFLGLFFAIDGLCGIVGAMVSRGVQRYYYLRESVEALEDPFIIGELVTYVGFLFLGLHLLLRPRWIVRMFLLSEPSLSNNNKLDG